MTTDFILDELEEIRTILGLPSNPSLEKKENTSFIRSCYDIISKF